MEKQKSPYVNPFYRRFFKSSHLLRLYGQLDPQILPLPLTLHILFLIFLQKSGLSSCFMTMSGTSLSFWLPLSFSEWWPEPFSLVVSLIMASAWSNAVPNMQPGHSIFHSHCFSGFPFLQESFPLFPLKVLPKFTSRELSAISSPPGLHGSFNLVGLSQNLQSLS